MGFRGNLIRRGINCTFSNVILGVPLYKYQAVPVAMTVADTITASALGSVGLVTGLHTAGVTQAYTLPTGAIFDDGNEYRGIVIGSSFDFTIINLSAGANTITLTGAAGFTIVGDPIVAITSSATFRIRKVAADTFVAYRIT